MIPIKFSATLIFSPWNFNFFQFSMNCPQRWKKWLSPTKNFVMGKNFDFEIFILKYVSNHFETIPTKKIFSTKIFWLCHFFTILVILAEKTKSHEKNFTREKIFDFEIFVLKYVSNHSESIPTKKFFRPKFFTFVIFSLFWPFWPKNH